MNQNLSVFSGSVRSKGVVLLLPSLRFLSLQVPEMLHNDAGDHGFSHCGFFLLQNAGILLGFCIMLLIALFEHRIRLDLG